MLNKTFTAELIKTREKGGWTYVIWPESVAFFETRQPVKVKGTVDGYEFEGTFLPNGDGTHMLAFKAATLKAIKKGPGESVEVTLTERVSPKS